MEQKHSGRNDPCPCGSGKKFKKCCIEKTAQRKWNAVVVQPSDAQNDTLKKITRFLGKDSKN